MGTRARQWVGGVALVVGCAALLWLYGDDPTYFERHWLLSGFCAAFFALAALAIVFMPRYRAWSKRTAGRMLRRRARRTFAPIAATLPLTIRYQLSGATLETTVDGRSRDRKLDLTTVAFSIATPDMLVLFRRRLSVSPLELIHLPGGAERRAVLEATARAGLSSADVDGPVDGYAPVDAASQTAARP